MERYLIDTYVISDYFAEALPETGLQFMDSVVDVVPNLSIITQMELLSWNTDSLTEQKVRDFLADSNVWDISPEVIQHCVRIRKGKKIKTPGGLD